MNMARGLRITLRMRLGVGLSLHTSADGSGSTLPLVVTLHPPRKHARTESQKDESRVDACMYRCIVAAEGQVPPRMPTSRCKGTSTKTTVPIPVMPNR